MKIEYGWSAPPLWKQLSDQSVELPDSVVQQYQENADSLSKLFVCGFLTKTEVTNARKRLYKQIMLEIKIQNEKTK